MALLGNYSVLHKSPAKYLTGTVGYGDRSNFNKPGMVRSRGASTAWQYDAQPSGTYAGRAYMAPRRAGRIVSRGQITLPASADGALGLPGAGNASLQFSGSAIGGLLASGEAQAYIIFSGAATGAGLAAGSAAATLRFSAQAAASAFAYGLASASVQFTGLAQPSAKGHMQATTVDNSVLSASAISSAVRTELQIELLRIVEIAKLHGLVLGTDLVVTETTRSAGSISQTISTAGGTTTVQRQP